jgi:hypothetical protein
VNEGKPLCKASGAGFSLTETEKAFMEVSMCHCKISAVTIMAAIIISLSSMPGIAAEKRVYAEETISFFSKDHQQKTESLSSLWTYKENGDLVISGSLDTKHLHVGGQQAHLHISLLTPEGNDISSRIVPLRFANGRYRSLFPAKFFARFTGFADSVNEKSKVLVEAHRGIVSGCSNVDLNNGKEEREL